MVRENLHDLDWDHLRHFMAFVEGRSLSAAAARLGVDHVTVSRRIAALEATLGVKLVDRRGRIPTLTAHGDRIAVHARRMADEAFGVARAARGLQPTVGGQVSISAPPTIASALIAPQLPVLRARHPAIRVLLLGEKRIASLARREADVAVRLVRPTEPGLVVRRLGGFVFRLYATRAYLASRPAAEHELIAFDTAGDELPQQRWLHKVARGRAFVLRTNDLESQLAAARAGLGIAALPDYLAARHAELVRVPVRARPVTREVWLAVHEDLRAAPSVRAVIDFVVEATRSMA